MASEAKKLVLLLSALVVLAYGQQSRADRPASGFPWCRCDATSFDTPAIITSVSLTETDTTRHYTFHMGTNGCLITSPCCGMDINKIAFHAKADCDGSMVQGVAVRTILRDYRVVTTHHAVQFRSYGANQLLFKVTNLRWIYPDIAGSNVTVSLRKGTRCDTLGTLLEGSSFAYLDKATTCCPTWALPALPA